METTFGRTVETRFLHANNTASSDVHLNPSLFNTQNSLSSSSTNFNSLNLNSIKSNQLKRQQIRQQQLQHIYLNSYKECNAPTSHFKMQDSTYLRPSMQVTPSSAILTRKKFKHLTNVSVNNGYSSDGDYCNTDNMLPNHNQINVPDFNFKRLNSTTIAYNSDYEDSSRYVEQEKNDLLGGLNMRENLINIGDREYDLKLMRYKSIERQHAKYVREHKNFQKKKKIEQSKIDSYRYQYLNEKLNEQINSRLTDLLSPKLLPKGTSNSSPVKDCDNFNNYTERIQYLLNKNNMRLQHQQQRQHLDSFNLNFQSNTIERQEKNPHSSNNLNLANYLTWKNCGNIYPQTPLTTIKPNELISTQVESNKLEENFKKNFDHNWLKESSRIHSKSLSTPSTPQLCTLPR